MTHSSVLVYAHLVIKYRLPLTVVPLGLTVSIQIQLPLRIRIDRCQTVRLMFLGSHRIIQTLLPRENGLPNLPRIRLRLFHLANRLLLSSRQGMDECRCRGLLRVLLVIVRFRVTELSIQPMVVGRG